MACRPLFGKGMHYLVRSKGKYLYRNVYRGILPNRVIAFNAMEDPARLIAELRREFEFTHDLEISCPIVFCIHRRKRNWQYLEISL